MLVRCRETRYCAIGEGDAADDGTHPANNPEVDFAMKMSPMNTFVSAALLLSMLGCSQGDGDGPGGSGPAEDLMEVSLDGKAVPTDPDPQSIATYGETFIAVGMQAPAPGGGFLDDDFVINFSTNGIVPGTYAFAEDRDLRTLNMAGKLAGTAAVFDFDGTKYESTLDGSVILDAVSIGEKGNLKLRWLTGSFSGSFESEAGVRRTASVRFAYTASE